MNEPKSEDTQKYAGKKADKHKENGWMEKEIQIYDKEKNPEAARFRSQGPCCPLPAEC